ncbi:Ctr copper transporter, partial [Lasiosphaeris hirsuta]
DTVDACFISDGWQIQSVSMFVGSCFGVILLAVLLELWRRLGKEYDRFLIKTNKGQSYQPHFWQQLVRAGIFTLQVANAYFLMLLAMYFNGYYIFCILIGTFIAFFAFQCEYLSAG